MRFRNLLACSVLALAAAACSNSGIAVQDDPGNNVGEKPEIAAGQTTAEGKEQSSIVIYDKTVNRIHQFNLNKNGGVFERSVPVENTGVEHFVMYDQAGNYIVDLSLKTLTIFDYQGKMHRNPIPLAGNPRSASFRPGLGYLVVYDELSNLTLMKLNTFGHIQKTATLGSMVEDGKTISSGDIDASGRLLLGLTDGSIALIDMETTINNDKWPDPVPSVQPSLGKAPSWMGPVRGNANQVLAVYDRKIYLLDISAPPAVAVLGTYDFTDLTVLQYSKLIDPHLVIKDKKQVLLVYAKNSQLKVQPVNHDIYEVEKSRLDVVRNNWTLIDVRLENLNSFEPHQKSQGRQVNRWSLSDMQARGAVDLPDNTVKQIGESSVLSLFPSPMGYAENLDLTTGNAKALTNFNVPYFP